jgi:hypothetical protein
MAFYFVVQPTSILIISICCLALLFLIVLFVEIIIYADITKGR